MIAALGAISLLAAFHPTLRLFTLALDAAFMLAVAFDFVRTPRPDRLDLRRRLPSRAGLGQDFPRTLRIAADLPSAAGLAVEVDEEFSAALAVRARTWWLAGPRTERSDVAPGTVEPVAGDPSGGPDGARIPRSGPIDLVRVYRSSLRGVHGVGDMRVRLTSRWGLIQRSSRLHGSKTIHIEPALLGMKRRLRLAASERWRDLGVRNLRRRGGLTEFESLRDHVIGDDVRLVDWKAFARRGRPIVRQFQEERGQELILLVDCGRRMATTTSEDLPRAKGSRSAVARGWTKLDHALDAALEIAAVALQEGDRVGLLAFDTQVRAWIPPMRGRVQLGRLREGVFALEARSAESDLGRALRELSKRHRRRALVLVLSDVADPYSVESQRLALHGGSRRHRIVFAGLDDPVLRAVADGRTPADPILRASAIALLEERRASLRALSGAGVQTLDALPAEAAAPLIAAWFEARRQS